MHFILCVHGSAFSNLWLHSRVQLRTFPGTVALSACPHGLPACLPSVRSGAKPNLVRVGKHDADGETALHIAAKYVQSRDCSFLSEASLIGDATVSPVVE